MTRKELALRHTTSFAGVRVTHRSPLNFDQVLANLRARVGETTLTNIAALGAEPGSIEAFEEKVQKYIGDSGFMLFAEMNHGAWIAKYGIQRRLLRWIFGNPVIAITMMRRDQTAGLFVPVELLLAEDDDATTCSVTYVVPSTLIATGDDAELLAAAKPLDAKVGAPIASCVGRTIESSS